ncbi:hypothetical protein AKJ09_06284 [Labilithrix luteola]|uniref:Yip1 domain-containing protein n=1 Tax=Labilithrix luteola TaxID=1391654 RepID=A0A0K1Q1F0_9BACT|nr:hypothetical protein [Labilithrix luteola]AKU99620.1 hypothetical protein AKJ09_06284 [Labilithrix luteola]
MDTARSIFDLLGPQGNVPSLGRAERLLLASIAMLGALACAAGWGALVGVASGHAATDAVLAPVLLLASGLTALPLTLFVARVFGRGLRISDLLLAYGTGAFAGGAALLLVAPLVSLYQHSSTLVGGNIGSASALFGVLFGGFVFVRTLGKLADTPEARRSLIAPTLLLLVLQALGIAQLASVMPPLFEHRTTIGHGVDALGSTSPEAP